MTILSIVGLALVLAACGGGDGPEGTGAAGPTVVAATLSDDMAIELTESEFQVGETVRFEITNAGSAAHELYLGDAQAQEQHAEEMAEEGMAHDDANGVSVAPGATEILEYTFDQAGEILAGCHEPGHYEAGMVTSISVAGE